MKRLLRLVVAHTLYYTGVLALLQRVRLRGRAVVLMYHRVLSTEERRQTGSHPGIVVSDETFARHLALLKRHFTVLSVAEFADHLERGQPFPDSSCLITFDDGWLDNRVNAWPQLREAGFPALIFLPVNFVGSARTFWRERLTSLVTRILTERPAGPAREACRTVLDEFGVGAALDVDTSDPRDAVSEVLGALKGTNPDQLETLADRLRIAAGLSQWAPPAVDRFMSWEDVAGMARGGVTFGGHGSEHVLLDKVPGSIAAHEIATAMTIVGERVPPSVATFSYPNGNWTGAIADMARAVGVKLAFTTEEGCVAPTDNAMALRRVNMSEEATRTAPLFLARVLGVF